MSATIKGFLNASISGITFGLIPLFAIPVLSTGMHSTSVLIYRYAFGCLAMLGMLCFIAPECGLLLAISCAYCFSLLCIRHRLTHL